MPVSAVLRMSGSAALRVSGTYCTMHTYILYTNIHVVPFVAVEKMLKFVLETIHTIALQHILHINSSMMKQKGDTLPFNTMEHSKLSKQLVESFNSEQSYYVKSI